ncbi:hypothetical protein SLEP1_g27309 [Rubroshorea leprosula]|uniref:C2H2-type domain-containing protein n=1 Tax=Rubroshorea leprosula TaxID=152421 RepID=A0AAV5JSS1_9ROSI|nr:hypothetical protein SLEP1_g27309 [Rubroshorea leprosula]
MIKRQFYKFEHGDGDDASDSSSSSDSELEAQATEESEEDVVEEQENDEAHSSPSGYKREDSSGDEVDFDTAGVVNEDDNETGDDQETFADHQSPSKHSDEIPNEKLSTAVKMESLPDDFPSCILKCKSVFKCKICPRIVCLNEDTMRAHLKSKRHARSEKLHKEGRLKAILNSDGEIENQEIAAETQAPLTAVVKDKQKKKKKQKGWHQRKGSRMKRMREEKNPSKDGAKKRHTNED